MGLIFFIILVGIPILEIAVFIEVGDILGMWETIAVIFITAIIGASLMRSLGLHTLNRARQSLENNIFPAKEAFDGLCLIIAGVLLLTPGFITDTIGFLLFLPPIRMAIGALIIHRIANLQAGQQSGMHSHSQSRAGFTSGPFDNSNVVDGDFRDITDPADPTDRPSQNSDDLKPLEHSDKP